MIPFDYEFLSIKTTITTGKYGIQIVGHRNLKSFVLGSLRLKITFIRYLN